jgi:hypothetical protein
MTDSALVYIMVFNVRITICAPFPAVFTEGKGALYRRTALLARVIQWSR